MLVRLWPPQTRLPTRSKPFYDPVLHKRRRPDPRRALKMAVTASGSKRPTCPLCSKPASLCICTRLRNPGFDNKVSVTILQHSLERKHPLNSARIVKIGLKNVTIATVSDANFGARFDIWLLEPGGNGSDVVQVLEFEETQKPVFLENDGLDSGNSNVGNLEIQPFSESREVKRSKFLDSDVECSSSEDLSAMLPAREHSVEPENGLIEFHGTEGTFSLGTSQNPLVEQPNSDMVMGVSALNENELPNQDFDPSKAIQRFHEKSVITITIEKYGFISLFTDVWMTQSHRQKLDLDSYFDLDKVLPSLLGIDAMKKGFIVKKLQNRQAKGGIELEECEEFELKVPPGSVLLFPSEKAIDVDDLKLIGFEVKNLIVLDGTWAKAKRMYNENPWLKLLPHLRLDLDKMSLYGEVRNQPKAGYLSTIESIVYAMKSVGDNSEELDDLLDVFESMIGDQKRCKDERLSKESIRVGLYWWGNSSHQDSKQASDEILARRSTILLKFHPLVVYNVFHHLSSPCTCLEAAIVACERQVYWD